jgi:hypothetical protein
MRAPPTTKWRKPTQTLTSQELPLEAAFRHHCIGYAGVDGMSTQKRNDVLRRFEASDATVLLAGTGTLNRGATVNGANHVLILNLEWSPETTLQAEDRCHRPGQTQEVHVHYLLSAGTVDEDEQMWDLVCQKAAAQRAVQDREAQHKSVEEILAEAALANPQLAVAKAVMQAEFSWAGATVEEAAAKAEEAMEEMKSRLVFGQIRAPTNCRRPRSKQEVKVLYFRSLFEAEEDNGQVILASAEQPVQLAMFAS